MSTLEKAPVPSPLSKTQGIAPLASPKEPVLEMSEIQGNSLVGFNKDYQSFLFFKITEIKMARQWLKALAPNIATLEETMAFRRLFRAARFRRGAEMPGLVATWINVAFTFEGLKKLTSEKALEDLPGDAFRVGMAARASLLGDEVDAHGNPLGWVVVSTENYPDLVLIVASDRKNTLKAEIKSVKNEMRKLQGISPARKNSRGLQLVYEQMGATLPGALRGHEHFGFKDGISQPGVRGLVTDSPNDFLTPRIISADDPLALTHSKPGQPLIWPGQFVLGEKYPRQNETDPVQAGLQIRATPDWTKNGSFLVIRRLKQNVSAFWQFLNAQAEQLSQTEAFAGMTAQKLASLMVGRWPSGAPIMRVPNDDNPSLGANAVMANNFNFSQLTAPVSLSPPPRVPDNSPPAPADASGSRCPFAAHIRKVNPRDDDTERGGSTHTLPKRVLRRGIPFGSPHPNPSAGDDGVDRGLMFVCYQTSIEEQFEFVSQDWANSPANPRSFQSPAGIGNDHAAGVDPIIGKKTANNDAKEFTMRKANGGFETIPLTTEWITNTGGGYFFSPSISAIKEVLARD